VIIDCAKLLSLIMKFLASGNTDMVVARQIDDENRSLLNSCQRVNTGHEQVTNYPAMANSSHVQSFFSHSVLRYGKFIIQKIENVEGHERILSSQKGLNDCGMRVLACR